MFSVCSPLYIEGILQSQILSLFSGPMSLLGGTPVPARGIPMSVPGVPYLAETGVPVKLGSGLGYPSATPRTEIPARRVTLQAVRLVRFPVGAFSCF